MKIKEIKCVAEAENGKILLDLFELGVTCDVLLLDLNMPILDGDESFSIIRKKFPEQKIIILSMYQEEELIKNYISRGAVGYLSKSENIEIVEEAIISVKTYGVYYKNIKQIFANFDRKELKKSAFGPREIEIVKLMSNGFSIKEISNRLCIVEKTVEAHRKNIYRKTKTSTLAKFIIEARNSGLNYLR